MLRNNLLPNSFKRIFSLLVFILFKLQVVYGQTCGAFQSLNPTQSASINDILVPLDSALKNEDLSAIDSLSSLLKSAFGNQAGIPEAPENYFALVNNESWENLTDAISLSRVLIDLDSSIYANLWKAAKGMSPPNYQPHSLFLRASAEIAVGLLQIAEKETDASRKNRYQNWALRALDSLATMQLPSGAFPFPDLRDYSDPVFTSVIQNFINNCGADSINVLQNGWIIDDKNSGEFKFDAGVIANAYYQAYQLTGNQNYKNIAISVGQYLMPLSFNLNFNYNTFASLGLTRAYQLTNDLTYLNRAQKTLRYAVFPGQLLNGKWVDGHNARAKYQSVMIQNCVPTLAVLSNSDLYYNEIKTMTNRAVQSMTNDVYTCESATGFRWLLRGFTLNSSVISIGLKDSITTLIGRHINQAAINGKYLDVPTMGEYLELLNEFTGSISISYPIDLKVFVYPNPVSASTKLVFSLKESDLIQLQVVNSLGENIKMLDAGKKTAGTFSYDLDVQNFANGVYYFQLVTSTKKYSQRFVVIH